MKFALRKPSGFTLIEILVVTSIMAVMFLVGFAGYRDYSRKQQLIALARQLQGDMRVAQQQALSGEKPVPANANCITPNVLLGWGIFAVGGGGSYQIYARCSGAGGTTVTVTTRTMPTGYTIVRTFSPFMAPVSTYFNTVGNGTSIPANFNALFTITDPSGATAVVTMTASGEIK